MLTCLLAGDLLLAFLAFAFFGFRILRCLLAASDT
jgi:hypothetical protein